jgi:uncharacterized membrane protein YvlD (DUF360 family)
MSNDTGVDCLAVAEEGMEIVVGMIAGVAVAALISGAVIWAVGKLGLGLDVDSFGWAMGAGLLIGFLTNLVTRFVPASGTVIQVVIHLVISAGAIFVSAAVLKGLHVKGFTGALVAALAIAVVTYLLLIVVLGGAGMLGATAAS